MESESSMSHGIPVMVHHRHSRFRVSPGVIPVNVWCTLRPWHPDAVAVKLEAYGYKRDREREGEAIKEWELGDRCSTE